MKKPLLLIIWLFTVLHAQAQVDNYALSFSGNGSVRCGELVQMEHQTSYTFQFWICPTEWNEGAVIFKSGDSFSACLGTEGSIVFTVGETSLTATAKKQLSVGNWAQVTLLCNEGAAKVYANTVKCTSGTLAAIPETGSGLVIGEGFKGRLDEMRFWKIALSDEFDYFRHNTSISSIPIGTILWLITRWIRNFVRTWLTTRGCIHMTSTIIITARSTAMPKR